MFLLIFTDFKGKLRLKSILKSSRNASRLELGSFLLSELAQDKLLSCSLNLAMLSGFMSRNVLIGVTCSRCGLLVQRKFIKWSLRSEIIVSFNIFIAFHILYISDPRWYGFEVAGD